MRIKRILGTLAAAGTLLAGTVVAAPAASALTMPVRDPGSIYVDGHPFNLYQGCKFEDGSGGPRPCRWDGRLMGNGTGRSYLVRADYSKVYVKLGPTPSRGTLAYYPMCATEYSPGICWWSANHEGNGQGTDFYVTSGGVAKSLPYRMIP